MTMTARAKVRAFSRVASMLLAVAAISGCGVRLAPAPGVPVVPGPVPGAVGREDGIRIIAYPDAWTASPPTLNAIVTPILVVIDNGGTVPLRLHHEHFALVTDDGTRLVALNPYEVTGFASVPASVPVVAASPRFSFSLGIGGYRGGRGRPYYYTDPFYDDLYYPISVQVPLPTPEMVQLALPARTVEPGARATGFLYFDRVKRKAKRVDFTARLVNATTGEQIGTLTIPFVTE
jgi:hypothetical protein